MNNKADFPTLDAQSSSISIRRPPDVVWDMASDVYMWPRFIPSVRTARFVSTEEYKLTTPLGTVVLRTSFDRDQLTLDHLLALPAGLHFIHACRLIRNHHGTELVASSVRRPREAHADFSWRTNHLRLAIEGLRELAER